MHLCLYSRLVKIGIHFISFRQVVATDSPLKDELMPGSSNNLPLIHSLKRTKRTTGYLEIPPASMMEVPVTENWDNELVDIPPPSRKRNFKTTRSGNSGCPCCHSRTKTRCGCPGYSPHN